MTFPMVSYHWRTLNSFGQWPGKCSKLVQRDYKTRHDGVAGVIHRELCKKFKFDHTTKWYMHNPESIVENETHKFLLDFEIQTNHKISARRRDKGLVLELETIQTTGLLRSTRILRRELKRLLLSLRWKTMKYPCCEKLLNEQNNNDNRLDATK